MEVWRFAGREVLASRPRAAVWQGAGRTTVIVIELCVRVLDAGLPFAGGTRWHFPGDDSLAPLSRRTELPIGNLTNQHFANRPTRVAGATSRWRFADG